MNEIKGSIKLKICPGRGGVAPVKGKGGIGMDFKISRQIGGCDVTYLSYEGVSDERGRGGQEH